MGLETVNFELFLFGDSNSGQILAYIGALVALELNDLTIFWMLYNCAVTSKLFLECADDLLLIKFVSDALDSGQRLATISLLNSNVDKIASQINLSNVVVIC